jgi:hypothetical protein
VHTILFALSMRLEENRMQPKGLGLSGEELVVDKEYELRLLEANRELVQVTTIASHRYTRLNAR